MSQPTVFISYSQNDEEEKDALLTHLEVLEHAGLIDVWSDDEIKAGADTNQEINRAIDRAKVAVLLITANFLTSEALQTQIPRLLKRRQNDGLTVFPVIARDCAWSRVEWLAKIQVRPKNNRPVWSDDGTHVDRDLTLIAEEVAQIINETIENHTSDKVDKNFSAEGFQSPSSFTRDALYDTGYFLLGKYQVVSLLGTGRWGDVYLAQDIELDRNVAIKHLRSDLTRDRTVLSRFQQEAKIVAGLDHRNIIKIYDLKRYNDDCYMIMEYAENGSLEKLVSKDGTLPIAAILDLVVDICSALNIVHSNGIVHRDIKPSNILFYKDSEGRIIPKLADFGVAWALQADQDARLTAEGSFLGTAAYMAPEQGQGRLVDARSDIYAMGVLLYELLTGCLPFTGNYLDILIAKTERHPVPTKQKRRDVPDVLDQIVMRSLAIEPEKRFQTAQEMAEALQAIIGRETITYSLGELELIYNEALNHFQHKNLQEAIKKFDKLTRISPAYRDAQERLHKAKGEFHLERLYQKGISLLKQREWNKAVKTFDELRSQNPNYKNVEPKWREAKAKEAQEIASKRIKRCQKLIEEEGWLEAEGCFRDILEAAFGYEEARRGYEQARRGMEAKLYYTLAIDFFNQKQFENAYQLLTTVTQIAEDFGFKIKGSQELLEDVKLHKELSAKREALQNARENDDWQAVEKLAEEITNLDHDDKQAVAHLQEAIEENKLEQLYQELLQDIKKEYWTSAGEKIEEIGKYRPNYRQTQDLRQKVANHKRWNIWYSDLKKYMKAKEWDEAIQTCNKIMKDFSQHEPGMYRDVYKLLERAKRAQKRGILFNKLMSYLWSHITKKSRWFRPKKYNYLSAKTVSEDTMRKRRIGLSFAVSIEIIALIIAFLALPGVLDLFSKPKISKFRISIDSDAISHTVEHTIGSEPLNLREYDLPALVNGETVQLKVLVIDEGNDIYAGNDLKCRWAVAPVKNESENKSMLMSQSCDIPYTPSQARSRQKVSVLIEGIEQQFKPVPLISMEFIITDN